MTLETLFSRYCPVVLILRPGDHIHINKGRLHAFRKIHFSNVLDPEDCHFQMRQSLKQQLEKKKNGETLNNICISIAWDWIYKGFTSIGITRELSTIVNTHNIMAKYNREKEYSQDILGKPFHDTIMIAKNLSNKAQISPEELVLARGILPVLRWAKVSLDQEETEFRKRGVKNITDDASDGIGLSDLDHLDRWDCSNCRSEIWCFYCFAKVNDESWTLCMQCVKELKDSKDKTYRRRNKTLTAESLQKTIDALEGKLPENRSYWWVHEDRFLMSHKDFQKDKPKKKSKREKGR